MNENIFDKLDFGPFRSLLDNDDITDISYDNGGQIWIRSLTQGSLRVEVEGATPEFVEKLAFQCSNVMGTTFNNAKPFLDAESAELRMNFVHQSIATNGIALVIRKTPAKIRLEKEKLIQEDYFTPAIHDFLIRCVEGHCNIMVAGETGSGKTEFVKYLASHTKTNEKIITIEDTLELHLDKIFPQRDIVSMKTNNVASYTDVLVTCMRQNPKWILLSEVRSAEAVTAVRNSISSGHNILSTIHADKASAIPYRLYSLMETDLDVHQFLSTIYRYIQLGVHIKAFYSKEYGKFHRELDEVCEFYVDDDNVPISRIIYQKMFGKPMMCKPSKHLIEYLENQNIEVQSIIHDLPDELPIREFADEVMKENEMSNQENENPTVGEESNNQASDSVMPPVEGQVDAQPAETTPVVAVEGQVVAPPTETTPVVAPAEGQAVTPPTESTPVVAPVAGQVVTSPTETTPVVAPVAGQVVTPPTETAPVVAPVAGQVVIPPTETTPVVAPVAGPVVTPPTETTPVVAPVAGQVVTPPTETTPVVAPVVGQVAIPPTTNVQSTPTEMTPVSISVQPSVVSVQQTVSSPVVGNQNFMNLAKLDG